MRGSEFVFNYVHSLYYKCHEIDPNCGRSYLDSPDWIKKKKKNNLDNKCFQYAAAVSLNHEEIGKYSERITKINLFKVNITGKEYIFHQEKMIR